MSPEAHGAPRHSASPPTAFSALYLECPSSALLSVNPGYFSRYKPLCQHLDCAPVIEFGSVFVFESFSLQWQRWWLPQICTRQVWHRLKHEAGSQWTVGAQSQRAREYMRPLELGCPPGIPSAMQCHLPISLLSPRGPPASGLPVAMGPIGESLFWRRLPN